MEISTSLLFLIMTFSVMILFLFLIIDKAKNKEKRGEGDTKSWINIQEQSSSLPSLLKVETDPELLEKEPMLKTWIPQERNSLTHQHQAEEAIRLLDKYSLKEGYIKWWLLFYRQRLNAQYIEPIDLPVLFQDCFPGQYVAMSDGIKEFYGFISPMQRIQNSLNIIFWDGNEKDYALGEDKKYMGYFSTSMDGTIRNDRTPEVKLVGIEDLDFSFNTKVISYRTKRVCYILEKIFWEDYENEYAHQQHYLV